MTEFMIVGGCGEGEVFLVERSTLDFICFSSTINRGLHLFELIDLFSSTVTKA